MSEFNAFVLKKFRELAAEKPEPAEGVKPSSWIKQKHYKFEGSIDEAPLKDLFNRTFTQDDLLPLRENRAISTPDLCALIFMWGGMNRDHGKMLFEGNRKWLGVAEELRNGKISAVEGYAEFYKLSKNGELKGCGPAYYTKLLYFLPPDGKRGHIMDQWLARSINFLTESRTIKMEASYTETVSQDNDEKVYEKFCDLVGKLAVQTNSDRDVVEMRLFSTGGRKKGDWRRLVSQRQSGWLGKYIVVHNVEGASPFCGAEIFETEKEASEAVRNEKNAKVAVIKGSAGQN